MPPADVDPPAPTEIRRARQFDLLEPIFVFDNKFESGPIPNYQFRIIYARNDNRPSYQM